MIEYFVIGAILLILAAILTTARIKAARRRRENFRTMVIRTTGKTPEEFEKSLNIENILKDAEERRKNE